MRARRRDHVRFLLLTCVAGLPGIVVSLLFVAQTEMSTVNRTGLVVLVVGSWLGVLAYVGSRSRFHLQTLSNLLAALREGDYSFRVRGGRRGDPYGEVVLELNALAENLRRQRVDDLEASALLRKVMAEIAGRPAIEHVVHRAGRAERTDELCLACSESPADDPLAAHVEALGYTVFRGDEEDVLGRFA